MSGKHRRKRRQFRTSTGRPLPVAPNNAAAATEAVKTAPPPPRPTAAPVKAESTTHLYIGSELRRIGITTGVVFVILIVLFLILT